MKHDWKLTQSKSTKFGEYKGVTNLWKCDRCSEKMETGNMLVMGSTMVYNPNDLEYVEKTECKKEEK